MPTVEVAHDVTGGGHSRALPFVPRVCLNWPEGVKHQSFDGTLVHIDISGFTTMSERFATKGKIGAEEVAGVLNRVFTELLTIADELGGDLLKFGGDALLILFTGADHASRCARAAAEMRTKLRSVGKVSTPAGRVSLRMSVGVHTGRHRLFLVGDSHQELIVAGPGASSCIEIEETASADEILVSPTTAAALPDSVLGDRKGPGVLLARTPPRPDAMQRRSPDAVHDPEAFVPVGLRRVLGSEAGAGEHRTITVAFIEFTGSDGLLRAQGPDALWERLDDLVRTVQQVVDVAEVTFAATDIDRDGGKIILTAGAPVTRGNDEERLLRSVREIADRYEGLPLKVGVNRGPAFAGDVGAAFRRTYTVIGDAVNLAARVMGKAEPGTVLSTGDALDRSETTFELEELEPFAVKGKALPVHAWRLGPIAGRRARVTADELPLVGRDEALSLLEGWLDEDPPERIIEVTGPVGVGKSRLVRELRLRREDVNWLFSACEQYEESTPYFPFRRLLREVLDIEPRTDRDEVAAALTSFVEAHAPELAAWLPLLATPLDLELPTTPEVEQLDPKFRPARLREAVGELFRHALTDPTALIIEDGEWMDDASRALLASLAAAKGPWTFVVARRPDGPPLDGTDHQTLELEPLPRKAATELATTALENAPVMDHQLAALVDRSAGNPLFLLELARTATERDGDLPDSIESIVQTRIDRLDPDLRAILRFSSVAGVSFDPALLAEAIEDLAPAIGEPGTWRGLHEFLVRRGHGEIRFRQAIFRDAAYSGLPFRTRRLVHERFARALEARLAGHEDGQAGLLALHFAAAEQWEPAWRYGVTAGDQARAKYAPGEAADGYRLALQAGQRLGDIEPSELSRVAEALGDVAELSGVWDEADKAYGRARSLIDDTTRRARLMRKQGLLREKTGAYPQALRWFRRGLNSLESAEGASAHDRIELCVAYAGVRFRQGRYRDTVSWCERALAIRGTDENDPARGHALYMMSAAYASLNEPGGRAFAEQALEIFESTGDLVGQSAVLTNLGYSDYFQGLWDRAVTLWDRARELSEQAGDVMGAARGINNLGEIYSDQGKHEQAEKTFVSVLRTWRAADYAIGVALANLNLGKNASRAGDAEGAQRHLEAALEAFQAIGANSYVLETRMRMAEAAALAGEVDRAARLIEDLRRSHARSLTVVQRAGLSRAAGYVALQRQDPATAREELLSSLADGREASSEFDIGLTLDALVVCGRRAGDDTTEWAEERERIFERLGVVHTPRLDAVAAGN